MMTRVGSVILTAVPSRHCVLNAPRQGGRFPHEHVPRMHGDQEALADHRDDLCEEAIAFLGARRVCFRSLVGASRRVGNQSQMLEWLVR